MTTLQTVIMWLILFPLTFLFWRWLATPSDCNQLKKMEPIMTKTLAALLLAAAACSAHAQQVSPEVMDAIQTGEISSKTYSDCLTFSAATRIVTSLRDGRQTPQDAFTAAHNYVGGNVTDDLLKRMINATYFTDDFANATPHEMSNLMFNYCLDPHHKYVRHYEPLQ